MKTLKEFFSVKNLRRRSFLKLAGLASMGLGLGPIFAKWGSAGEQVTTKPMANWKIDEDGNQYFVPKNIYTDLVNDQGIVIAKVDGLWRKYQVREFDDEFHSWWIDEKSWYYDMLIAFFKGESNELNIPNGGHHHPMLTTYGRKFSRRGDSDFHLNTAVKGFTIIPKVDNIDHINSEVERIYETGDLPLDLFNLRKELYQDKSLWDKTRFATLELYSGRPINDDDPEGNYGFKETKTFQNIMANPMSVLTYMALWSTDGSQSWFGGQSNLIPEFGFKGFSWLISTYNPATTDYEMAIINYINQAHCGYHGGACDIATNIFLICEQFNETPDMNSGRGKRVVPPYQYSSSSNMVINSEVKVKKKLSKDEKMELIRKLRLPV